MQCTRDGDTVILHSENRALWFGALFGGFSLFILILSMREGHTHGFGYLLGVSMAAAFVGIGGFMMVPREVTTTFDLQARKVTRRLRVCSGLYQREVAYAFDEIESIGIKEYSGDGFNYMPVLTLKSGSSRKLAMHNSGYLNLIDPIKTVCAATGLPHRDTKADR